MSATAGFQLANSNSSTAPMREIDTEIIENVRLRPLLYKSHLRADLRCRSTEWQNVAQAVGLSTKDCQRRWRVLRDRYCRLKRSVTLHENSSGSPFRLKRPWPYYDLMAFLGAHVRHKKSCPNDQDRYGHFLDDDDDTILGANVKDERPCSDELPKDFSMDNKGDPEFIQPTNRLSSPKQNARLTVQERSTGCRRPTPDDDSVPNNVARIKRSRISIDTQLVRMIRSTQSTIMDLLSRRPNLNSENDEDELFGQTVVASLKKLPHNKRLEAKARFFQLLTELEHSQAGITNS